MHYPMGTALKSQLQNLNIFKDYAYFADISVHAVLGKAIQGGGVFCALPTNGTTCAPNTAGATHTFPVS